MSVYNARRFLQLLAREKGEALWAQADTTGALHDSSRLVKFAAGKGFYFSEKELEEAYVEVKRSLKKK